MVNTTFARFDVDDAVTDIKVTDNENHTKNTKGHSKGEN